ncbi:MAG: phytanoyl-CoA dioxygenase family protein [Armatimonadetes bacterium]|nr:phytanoyl-CoA dioxygenase family protein [Armatimonadota bacterium]MDE2208080.1 phytanoyl-CoA dioxygenase family protein [Armatimonadota bacterium]
MDELGDASALLARPAALRERAAAEGVLLLRGLAPAHDIAALRLEVLRLCAMAGWLHPRTDPREGVAAPGTAYTEQSPEYRPLYREIQRLRRFHALALHPALLAAVEAIVGRPVLAHPRNIARVSFPACTRFTTPAHQDFYHVRGCADTWTAWIPLGACPRERGGLAVMPGSHAEPLLATHAADGAGGAAVETGTLPWRWATADYDTGDVLLFHSHTIHKALPNMSPDRLRLSVDYRYQRAADAIHPSSLEPHLGVASWEEVYDGWPDDGLRYYWRALNPRIQA